MIKIFYTYRLCNLYEQILIHSIQKEAPKLNIMIRILLVICISVKACNSSGGIRHQLRVADDKICEMLKNPTYATSRLIFKTIKEFNDKVLKLAHQVENPKGRVNPQKRIIRVGELVIKYKPKFTSMKIDVKKLKATLHWNDRSINYLKYLVKRSINLRTSLYKACKRNYKYYQPQEYYEPKEQYKYQQQQYEEEVYEHPNHLFPEKANEMYY